jgi:hypothetical protein
MGARKTSKKSAKAAKKAPKGARKPARNSRSPRKTTRRPPAAGSSIADSRKKPSSRARRPHQRPNDAPEKNQEGQKGAKTKPPGSRELTIEEQDLVRMLHQIQAGELLVVPPKDLDRMAMVALAAGALAGLATGFWLAKKAAQE